MIRIVVCTLTMSLMTLLVTASAQEPAPALNRTESVTTVEVEAVGAPQDAELKKDAIPKIMEAAKAVINLRGRAGVRDTPAQRVDEMRAARMNIPDEIIQNYAQQLRPIMRGNLHLIRSLCDPTEEQRWQLAEAAEDLLPELARKLIEEQQTNSANLDVISLFSEELAGEVEAILGPRQVALYLAEVEARDTARKRASANALMAAMDPFVKLSAEQREQLRPALIERWDGSWFRAAEMARQNFQYMPAIPEECLTGVLTEAQMNAWRSRSPNTLRIGGIHFGQQFDNSALDPDGPPPARVNPALDIFEAPRIIR